MVSPDARACGDDLGPLTDRRAIREHCSRDLAQPSWLLRSMRKRQPETVGAGSAAFAWREQSPGHSYVRREASQTGARRPIAGGDLLSLSDNGHLADLAQRRALRGEQVPCSAWLGVLDRNVDRETPRETS